MHVSVLGNQGVVPMDMLFKELGQSVWKSKTTERDGRTASNQRLLERLEAENAQLRERVVGLALQIQALRGRARTLTA